MRSDVRPGSEEICKTCGKPVAGSSPRSDVTHYLAEISRCSCAKAANNAQGVQPQSSRESATTEELECASRILSDRYKVVNLLGRGGMGTVFKISEKGTARLLAAKVLKPELTKDEYAVKRFELEAKAAMQLTSAHIGAVYAYGVGEDGSPYILMDFLEGSTLDYILKHQRYMNHKRAVELFVQLCEALTEAHSKGVVHRDLKPSNIMITRPSEDLEFVKLFDFGVAKVMENQSIDLTIDMTKTGDLLGTPLYMSPEQCRGNKVDARSDIYALGCIMYKTLTGIHPFEGKTVVETIAKIASAEPVSMLEVKPKANIPPLLNEVVLRCLSKDPDERYASTADLQKQLEEVQIGKRWKPNSKVDKRIQLVVVLVLLFGLTGICKFCSNFVPAANVLCWMFAAIAGVILSRSGFPFDLWFIRAGVAVLWLALLFGIQQSANGFALMKDKNFGGAENAFTISLTQDPTNVNYLVGRATARAYQHKYDKALLDCNNAIALNTQNPGQGRILLAPGKDPIVVDPRKAQGVLYLMRSICSLRLAKLSQAIQDANQVSYLAPEAEGFAELVKAESYRGMGLNEDADKAKEQATKLGAIQLQF